MKKFLFLSLIGLSWLHTAQAGGCRNRSNHLLMCAGDTVVNDDGWTGTVMGINPMKRKATVRWQRTGSGYSTNRRSSDNIENLALGDGCVKGYCVNDIVMNKDGWTGTIIGVNPYKKEAGVRWSRTGSGYSTNRRSVEKIRKLAIGLGCMYGYCVGDQVQNEDGWSGEIVGLNAYRESAGVRWRRTGSGYSTNRRNMTRLEDLSNSSLTAVYSDNYRYAHTNDFIIFRLDVMVRSPIVDLDFSYRF